MNRLMIALVILLSITACKKDMEYQTSFKKSEKAWHKFKASSNNSYRFEVVDATWEGSSWKTNVKVVNGVAVERKFEYMMFMDIRKSDEGWTDAKQQEILTNMNMTAAQFKAERGKDLIDFLEWTETGAMVGTQALTSASNYLTLDEVYDKAENYWLKKRSGMTTYFEAKNSGMISSCGFFDKNCADDCGEAIAITLIEAL